MYKITYRPFEPGDFEPVAELMRAQWSCDMADEAGVYSSAIDLCGYLAQTDWSLVAAREDGEVLGAALLRLNDNRSTTWEKRRAAPQKDRKAKSYVQNSIFICGSGRAGGRYGTRSVRDLRRCP